MNEETEDQEVSTTNGTYPWSFVTNIGFNCLF